MTNNNLFVLSSLAVFSIHFGLVLGQRCNDCLPVRDCSEAIRRVTLNDPESQRLLRSAFCGFKNKEAHVCCAAIGDESLDSHPNLSLLPQECGFINGDRLIGGKNAGLYSFPWMVLISHKTRDGLKFDCGGTLISDRYVLTASHCIQGLQIAGVRVGEYDLRVDTDCEGEGPKYVCENHIQDIRVEEAIVHPGYHGKPGVLNDIGLLRLKKLVDTSHKNAKPVCLPVTSALRTREIFGLNATLAGWGFTENHEASSILQTVDVPVHSAENCRNQYNRGNSPSAVDATLNKFCAGTVGKDSCNGDSGGPLMLAGQHSNKVRFIQYGIVSYGPRLCGSQFPGVYTDVSKYMKWILDTIKP